MDEFNQNNQQPAPNTNANMVTCKSCGATIAKSAKTCPGCGAANSKPVFKKPWFWIVVVAVIAIIAGCTGGKDKESEPKPAETTAEQTVAESAVAETTEKATVTTTEKKTTVPANPYRLGDYEVQILSVRTSNDHDGSPVIIVKYKFTNNSNEATSFAFAINDACYQNGIALETAYTVDFADKSFDSKKALTDIKPGVSLEVERAYELNDETSDIEVECKELVSFSNDKVTQIFTLL